MVYHATIDGMEEQHTKHVTYKIAYHFVWCPKYRKAVLRGDIAQFVESEIRRLCEENTWAIGAVPFGAGKGALDMYTYLC